MKISLGDFEALRQSPPSLKQQKLSGKRSGPPYMPNTALRNVILWTHKNGASRQEAIAELEHKYRIGKFDSRIQKSDAALAALVAQLEEYLDDHARLGLRTVHTRERIKLSLPPEIAANLTVGGEIPRVETDASGRLYAWFFASKPRNWQTDLRLPIVQSAIADQAGAPYEEVFVGVYCFEDGLHHRLQFTASEIQAAKNELAGLLHQLL